MYIIKIRLNFLGSIKVWRLKCLMNANNKLIDFVGKNIFIIVLFICSFGISLVYYSGYFASDDYGSYANNIVSIVNNSDVEGVLRLPIVFQGIISYLIFGKNVDAIPYIFTIGYPIVVLLAYILSYMLGTKKTAITTSILIFGMNVYYVFGGAIMPDNTVTNAVLLSYIFIILAFKESNKLLQIVYIIITSFFATIVFMLKEPILITLVGFFPLGLYYIKDIKKCLVIAIEVLIGFILFYLLNKIIAYLLGYGINLAAIDVKDYSTILYEENVSKGTSGFTDHLEYAWSTLLRNLFYKILVLITVIGFFYSIIKWNSKIFAISLSVIIGFVFYSTISISFDKFVGLPIQFRYFAPLYALMAVVVGLFVNELFKGKAIILNSILSILFLTSIHQIYSTLPLAGNIYFSVYDDIFKSKLNEITDNKDINTLYYSKDCSRYIPYYTLQNTGENQNDIVSIGNDNNVILKAFNNNEQYVFDKNDIFVYSENDKSQMQYLYEYSEDMDMIYTETKVVKSGIKEWILPFLTKSQLENTKDYYLYFGEFQYTPIKETILEENFEIEDNKLLFNFRKDNVDMFERISESNNHFGGLDSSRGLMYMYKKLTKNEIQEYETISLEAKLKCDPNTKAILSITGIDEVGKSNKTTITYTESEWKEMSVSLGSINNFDDVSIQIIADGEGSIYFDDIEIIGIE